MLSRLDLGGICRATILLAVGFSGLSCGSAGGPVETAPGLSSQEAPAAAQPAAPVIPQPTATVPVQQASPPPTEPTAPGPSAAVQPANAGPAPTEAPKVTTALPLAATTRRTADGLPDPVAGYQAWYRLGSNSARADEARAGHEALRQTYILLPVIQRAKQGQELIGELPEGTTIVLEGKSLAADFVGELSVMTKAKAGWQFFQYMRDSSRAAFSPSTKGTEGCSGCHSKAASSDSVYSKRLLE